MVRLRDLQLVLKICHCTKPTHNNGSVYFVHKLYQQTIKGRHRNVWNILCHFFYHTNTFF